MVKSNEWHYAFKYFQEPRVPPGPGPGGKRMFLSDWICLIKNEESFEINFFLSFCIGAFADKNIEAHKVLSSFVLTPTH